MYENYTELAKCDPIIAKALFHEKKRQQTQIEMIASENTVSISVLAALGSEIANKTVEGYPGNRFHGGAEFADVVESTAIERAKELFGCQFVNVQPHSGTQANQAVLAALLKPGDKILSLDLAAGGHLSHGAKASQSGRIYSSSHYHVKKHTGLIDYDKLEAQAKEIRPALLIAGASAYPREIKFPRMRQIADSVGAYLLVDMAHFAGLVAAGVHASPIPHADVVSLTTTKTMRGPRGGLILSNRKDLFKKIQYRVFPGVQGSAHLQVIAAKAVCLGEALMPEFKEYGQRVKENARALAQAIEACDIKLVGGGTDTHIVLLDFTNRGFTGHQAQEILEKVNITSNKNPVPFDSPNPSQWAGLRLGTSSGTTRGFGESEFKLLGQWIGDLLGFINRSSSEQEKTIERIRPMVNKLCRKYPIYN